MKRGQEIRSPEFLDLIRQLPCVRCLIEGWWFNPPIAVDPHHPRGLEFGTGTGLKASDFLAFPLGRMHQEEYQHDTGAWPWSQRECIEFTWALLNDLKWIPADAPVGEPCEVPRRLIRMIPSQARSFALLRLFPGLAPVVLDS